MQLLNYVLSYTDSSLTGHATGSETNLHSLNNLDWSKANFNSIQHFISYINWDEIIYTTPSASEL